jgi:cell division protein FtsN
MPEIVVANPEPVPAPAVQSPRHPVQAAAPAHTPTPITPEPLPAAVPSPPPAQVAAAPAPAATSSGATLTGGAVLQIGSFPSEALAGAAWARFSRTHAGAISGLSHDVVAVQLPGKGTWYRLRVGPFPTRAAAGTKCAELKGQGATCLVAVP